MVTFSTAFRIVGKSRQIYERGGVKYRRYVVMIGKTFIGAFIPANVDLQTDWCIKAEKCYLDCDKQQSKVVPVLVVLEYEKVSEDVLEMFKELNVVLDGRFIKSSNCVLRTVGAQDTLFFAATFSVKIPEDSPVKFMIVAFGKNAELLSHIESNTRMRIRAKMVKNREGSEFELNLKEIL